MAVITGGGRGTGYACAEALGQAGAHLVILEPDLGVAETAVTALPAKGFKTEAMAGDVRDAARMTACADDLAARGTATTIRVTNAGGPDGSGGLVGLGRAASLMTAVVVTVDGGFTVW